MAKQVISGNYTYTAASRTLQLTNYSAVTASRLLVVVDITTGDTIYNFADKSGSPRVTASGTTFTFGATNFPAGTANTDALLIIYDNVTGDPVVDTVKVDGSGVTQPVSGTVSAAQSGTWTVQPGNTANTTAWKVDGSAVTQPISAASLPLPSGASTAAKQPALGTAGTPSADVLTVQGVTSMTALKTDGSGVTQPVSGTVTVQQSTASSLKVDLSGTAANATAIKVDGSAVTQPVSGTVGVSGTVTVDSELTTADLDTGVGTDTRAVVGLVGSKSGGGVLIPGDATKGLAVDLTATGANTTALKVDGSAVTQPVSGTIGVSGTVTVDTELPAAAAVSADANAAPTAPMTYSPGLVSNGTTWDRMKGSQGDGGSATGMQNILGMLYNGSTHDRMRSPSGDAMAATGLQGIVKMLWNGSTYDRARGDTTYGQYSWTKRGPAPATPAQSSVSVTSASTSVLASNANRMGATIWNEGGQTAYVKLGGTASTTSYSVQVASGGYYEVPFGYTGAIDAITSTSTAQLRITELSA